MTSLIAVSVAAAGLVFSISVALLVEELIFGAIFRLLFGEWGRRKECVTAGFEYAECLNTQNHTPMSTGR